MNAKVQIVCDAEGYLIDPDQWDATVAVQLADKEEIELDDTYWPILNFMHEYWLLHRVAPDVRHVVDFLVREQGYEKRTRSGICSHYFLTDT